MTDLTKAERKPRYLKPNQTARDVFKVYDKGFLGHKQFDAIKRRGRDREICIDPEVVFRLATLGLSREQIAGYWGLNKVRFSQLCEEYPFIDEVFLMGTTAGVTRAAQVLEELVNDKQMVPVIFRLKTAGFIEADKLIGRQSSADEAPRVQVFLPDNGREDVLP